MTALAFKRGQGIYSILIKKLTGGEFSHVELWLSGPITAAVCYSSRESGQPAGSALNTLDLSNTALWEIVPLAVEPAKEDELLWFCRGSSGRPYDYLGIAGIGLDRSELHVGAARFCSNECTNVLQQVVGWWPGLNPWMVAPSGFAGHKDRYGLIALAKALTL